MLPLVSIGWFGNVTKLPGRTPASIGIKRPPAADLKDRHADDVADAEFDFGGRSPVTKKPGDRMRTVVGEDL